MSSTYTPIATQTVSGSSTGTVTFSSIPSIYTDALIVCNFGLASASRLYLRFNGSTATDYSDTWLTGEGSAAYSGRDTSQNAITAGGAWNGCSTSLTANCIITVMNYANTTTNKTVLAQLSNQKTSGGSADANVGLWRQTSAITSINVVGGAVFLDGSTFALYGIKAE